MGFVRSLFAVCALATLASSCSNTEGLTGGSTRNDAGGDDAALQDATGAAGDAGSDADAASTSPFGTPQVIEDNLPQPTSIVADADSVCWLQGDNAVVRRPGTVVGAMSVLAQALLYPRAPAVGAQSVFFAAGISGGWTYVHEVPKTGGTLQKSFGNSSGEKRIPAISVEGNGIALVSDAYAMQVRHPRIKRGNTDGTLAFDVATEQIGATAVILRAPYVYWNTTSSILRSSGQAPSPAEVFSSEAIGVGELAADDAALYWAASDGELRSLSFDKPGATAEVLDTGLKSPHGIAVDGNYVYWASPVTGEVVAVPKAGGAHIVIATGQVDPYGIAVTDTAVFFTNRSAGTLVRVPKN